MLWGEVRERHGRVVVPYVRLVSRKTVRRTRLARLAGWMLIGALGLVGFLAALWELRWIVLGVVLVWASVRLLRHRPGCAGLHCSGCRG